MSAESELAHALVHAALQQGEIRKLREQVEALKEEKAVLRRVAEALLRHRQREVATFNEVLARVNVDPDIDECTRQCARNAYLAMRGS